ncbi:MAG: amidohydrolase family protein [Desulfobacteraceae bacterium]
MKKRFKGARVIRHGSGRAIHRAGFVVVSPGKMIQNGAVTVDNGIITGVSKYRPGTAARDHGPGVLVPGLVNAHLHLELSALAHRLSFDSGFKAWVKQLLDQREVLGEERLAQGADRGAKNLVQSGTLFAAEITTLGITARNMRSAGLGGTWFREFLGPLAAAQAVLGDPKKGLFKDHAGKLDVSAAGHAPHTASPELLVALKQETRARGLCFSIHVAESEEERQFITTGKGQWADFLRERDIDFSSWPVPAPGEIAYLDRLNLLDEKTLVVHLLNCDEKDFERVAARGAKPVLCPRSNVNLHGKLPNLPAMVKAGLTPALGTDSLASCDSLSLFDEMAFVSQRFPAMDPASVFAMATVNGAVALGLGDRAGSLEPGKTGDCLYLPLSPNSINDFLESVTHHD